MNNKVAFVNVEKDELRVKELDDPEIMGPVDWGLRCHLKIYESYKYPPNDEHNVLCMGMGKLAGSCIPGTHRITLCFRSPLWGGFFFSTMGGAAYVFKNVGVDYLTIEDKSKEPKIMALKGTKSGIEAKFDTIDFRNLMKIYKGYDNLEGVHALQKFVLDKFLVWYEDKGTYMDIRSLTVGPAALNTNFGGIFSSAVKRGGEIDEGSEDWAARGGPGSVMFKAHGLVALVFGGNNDWREFGENDLRNTEKVNNIFQESLGKSMMKIASDATVKYRYDGSVGSGGTFGVNYFTLRDQTIMFNWGMVHLPKEKRLKLYEELVKNCYKAQFDREITERFYLRPSVSFLSFGSRPIVKVKVWKNCGEPCPGLCKKVRETFKKDYEPYEANGPNCGIFDQRAAEFATGTVDSLGFDAIEFGNVASWVFECIHRGLLGPEEVGLDGKPSFDPDSFKVEDSSINAELLVQLANAIAYGENEVARVIGWGMRRAAKKLDEKLNNGSKEKFEDFAVFVACGEGGSMVPAMYWGPGNFMPILIPGKYYTHYHSEFKEPEDLADMCFERAVKEMYSENTGLCRFHRGWGEKILPKLFEKGYGIKINYDEHSKKILTKINEYNIKAGLRPTFWESERAIDVVATMSREFAEKTEVAKKWWDRFNQDKMGAAKEYWTRFLERYEKLLNDAAD